MTQHVYTTLREANRVRQREWDAGNKISLPYRGNELAGEVGEACNIIKKLERQRLGIIGSRATVGDLARELADVVICTDLIAMAEGIDLDEAVAAKFNATSEEVGLLTRLYPAASIKPEDAVLLAHRWEDQAGQIDTHYETNHEAQGDPDKDFNHGVSETLRSCASALRGAAVAEATELATLRRQVAGYQHHLRECEQIAGRALDYPWFKDDQVNFPGATEQDGVCVGEHVGDSIVAELAKGYRSAMALVAVLESVLNTPEVDDFLQGVKSETPHQRFRWGSDHDAGKGPLDWVWLLGHLVNKAARAAIDGDVEKAKHHTISSAAALANWHAALSGKNTVMRPGIDASELAGLRVGLALIDDPVSAPVLADGETPCEACGQAMKEGDTYYPDLVSGGVLHAECVGQEREGFTDAQGEPLAPDAPIPSPMIWSEKGR